MNDLNKPPMQGQPPQAMPGAPPAPPVPQPGAGVAAPMPGQPQPLQGPIQVGSKAGAPPWMQAGGQNAGELGQPWALKFGAPQQ